MHVADVLSSTVFSFVKHIIHHKDLLWKVLLKKREKKKHLPELNEKRRTTQRDTDFKLITVSVNMHYL